MAWIESHQALRDHPKTRRLARLLDVDVPAAIGHLHLLWWWSLDYAPTGDLTNIEPDVLADGAGWSGPPEKLIESLLGATKIKDGPGFLERDGERLVLHDWMDYAGALIVKRQADAERKRDGRPKSVRRTSGGRPVDGAGTAHVPTDLPTNLKGRFSPQKGQEPVDNSRFCPDDGALFVSDGFAGGDLHCPVCNKKAAS